MTLSDMTNEALNYLAAIDVMGWEHLPYKDADNWYKCSPGKHMRVKRWKPATDIAHAFLLQGEIKDLLLSAQYVNALHKIVIKELHYGSSKGDITFALINATPRQRTEAAVKAVQG